MMKRVGLILVGCVFVAAAQDPAAMLARARAAVREAPPVPAHYDTPKDLQAAVKAGKHPQLGPGDAAPFLNGDIVIERDVEYSNQGDISLKLDVYRPAQSQAPAPALLFIHGGGWKMKGKEFYAYWSARYANKGYVCATIEYRTSNEAIYPAAIQDVNCAIRWLKTHAADYGIDPTHIGLIGQSAGAHLALMAAYTDSEVFQGTCDFPGVDTRVQAVVEYYGPTDLTLARMYTMDVAKEFIGTTFGNAPQRYTEASPVEYVTTDDPPTLIFHGTIDGLVPIVQADILAEALDNTGVPYVYDRIEGWDHGLEIFNEVNEHCMYVQDRFLEAYLPLPPPPPEPAPVLPEASEPAGAEAAVTIPGE